MTLIIGAIDKDRNKIVVGSDGLNSSNDYQLNRGSKLIKVKNFIVGFSRSERTGQLIKFNKKVFKKINRKKDVFNFLQRLRKILLKDGSAKETKEGENLEHAVALILATRVGLYEVYGDYCFFKCDVAATGGGKMYGLGYFCGSNKSFSFRKRIKETIKATSRTVPGVGGTITIKELSLE